MPDFKFSNEQFSYQLHYPLGDDKLLVDFYCEVDFTDANPASIEREILPFTGCEITFNLTKDVKLKQNGELVSLPSSYVLGQPSILREYCIQPGTTTFIIRLKQHLLKSFLHDRSQWRDMLFQIEDKFGNELASAFTNIAYSKSFDERIASAQQAIQHLSNKIPDNNFDWLRQIQSILNVETSVEQLAKQVFSSVRQLERKFVLYYDLPPREYIRLMKLSDSLDHYARNSDSSATDASYEGGFTDQAHFIKTFRMFTTQTPLKFFKKHNIKKSE